MDVEIRPLAPDDNRRDFSCGQSDLDRFFHHYAGQNQFKLHLAVTYVAVMGGRIVGFATVTATALEPSSVPDKRLQARMPGYLLPVVRLARLGVDARVQGRGLGKILLRHVFALARTQRESFGCIGITVDSKPDSVKFYESLGFIPIKTARTGMLHGEYLPMFIPIDTIERAMG